MSAAEARRRRFGRGDWVALGLARLAEIGPEALTLEALCDAAQRSKGSFYHHFLDHAAFVDAVLVAWRDQALDAVIRLADEAGDAAGRLSRLNDLAARLDPGLEAAMRRFAAVEPKAAEAVRAVDERRVAYLAELTAARFGVGPPAARTIAEIEYAVFIGHLAVWPQAGVDHRRRIGEALGLLVEAGAERL